MYTYQDFEKVKDNETEKRQFLTSAINSHKNSNLFNEAVIAYQYAKHKNKTITDFQKLLYTVTGKAVPDNFSANFKMARNFFGFFTLQQNQFLLGNGVSWDDPDTESKLGTKRKSFDAQLKKAGLNALIGGVSFGFWNLDHVDVFKVTEFAPLFDEENGTLRAGVRFWQLEDDKPMRVTLYEEDGYTEYKVDNDNGIQEIKPKQTYTVNVTESVADGVEISDGRNYSTFPIVPLWANEYHQSEIVGIREQIDCYDLIKSGFANSVDEASYLYWVLQNAGGMDDVDLAEFIYKIKTTHAVTVEDGVSAESHQAEVPYASRETLLSLLRSDLFADYMAFDTDAVASGSVVQAQIEAAYTNINLKADGYEYQVLEFVDSILDLAGIDDEATFTRSRVTNVTETIQTLLQAAPYLDSDYVTGKILELLGDGDKTEDILKKIDENALGRLSFGTEDADAGENAPEDAEA